MGATDERKSDTYTTHALVETAAINHFFVVYNPHTNHYDVQITKRELFEGRLRVTIDRQVTVCSHSSKHLAEDCVQGISCAYGTPVGRLS
jgi:hypothetical protein